MNKESMSQDEVKKNSSKGGSAGKQSLAPEGSSEMGKKGGATRRLRPGPQKTKRKG